MGIYTVEFYLKVRLAVSEGMKQRQAAKHFNISRETVAKMLAYSTPPGYQRRSPIRRPKLDAFVSTIEHWLDEDLKMPLKQRHTAKRVFDRLRDECGFHGRLHDHQGLHCERDQRRQEVFVPLSHPPGHAQADFGEATVVIGGVEQKARFFVLDLPHSDGCYVRAYPAAVAEAWVDGHIHAFAFFGAGPQSIVYDNDRCLVAKILPDGTRKRAALFSGFLSHYLIRDRYGRPGKGNDKGNVEGLVGYARRNFMVPIPRFPTWDAGGNDEASRFIGTTAGVGDRLGDLLERGRRLFDRGRLLLGPFRKVVGCRLHFRRAGGDRLCVLPDSLHGGAELSRSIVEVHPKLFECRNERLGQVGAEVSGREHLQAISEGLYVFNATRNVRGELDDLEDLSVHAEDRVVRSLDVDLVARAADPHEFLRHKLAGAQAVPENTVVGRAGIVLIAKDRMVLSDDLGQLVAKGLQEVFVSGDNFTVRSKFDDRLRPRERVKLSRVFGGLLFDRGNIGRELDDLVWLAPAENRIVRRFDPDVAPALGDAAVLFAVKVALSETVPECAVLRQTRFDGIDEHSVMAADDLGELVTESRAEVGVCGEDGSVQVEFDDRLRLAHGGQYGIAVGLTEIRYFHMHSSLLPMARACRSSRCPDERAVANVGHGRPGTGQPSGVLLMMKCGGRRFWLAGQSRKPGMWRPSSFDNPENRGDLLTED